MVWQRLFYIYIYSAILLKLGALFGIYVVRSLKSKQVSLEIYSPDYLFTLMNL